MSKEERKSITLDVNQIVLGKGTTRISVLSNELNEPCVVISTNHEPTKIGETQEDRLKDNDKAIVLECKNSKGTKVLIQALKVAYKELKKQEKQIGLY